jgi:hypothetical protein
MIYDYIIIGNNLNSLMIAYYLFKENYKILIIDMKNKEDHRLYYNKDIVIKNPLYSNNDVNFLNFLNNLSIDFRLIGKKCNNISFNLIENFKLSDLCFIFSEFFKEFTYDYSSKNIKLIDKINLFSNESINYIKSLCIFYELDFNIITVYDFIQIINNCITGEFFTIDENKLLDSIYNYFNKNTNIEIIFNEKFLKLDSVSIKTNKRYINFFNKCIFSVSPNKIDFINSETINNTIYNYKWNSNIDENIFNNYNIHYIKNNNEYTFFSNKNNINEIKNTFFFLDNNYISNIVKYNSFTSFINNNNYVIINNQPNIESNSINNINIINKIINYKKNKVIKNDSIVDILKLLLIINIFIK